MADDAPTSATLMVSVTNFEGVPVEDVAIDVRRAGTTTAVRSNAYGQAGVALDDPREAIEARVADARFVAGAPIVQQTLTGPVVSFRVFAADTASLAGAERQAYVDLLPEMLAERTRQEAALALVGTDQHLTLAGLSLFLADGPIDRVAAPTPPPAATEADRPITAISTRLLGPRGDAVAGVLVNLVELDPQRRDLAVASWQRSDDTGLVLFEEVRPGAFYRLEVSPSESAFDARSTIVRAIDGRAVTVPPMVLRAPGQTLSGFVYVDDAPASASLVVLTDDSGREVLRSATDTAGFFSLGPVVGPGGPARLGVRRATRGGVQAATVRVDPAAGDVLVPLDLLAAPTR